MRREKTILAIAMLLSTLAARSALAVEQRFTGIYEFRIATLNPVALPARGLASVNGSAGLGHLRELDLQAGAFATTALVLPVTDPGVFPVAGLQITASNAAGRLHGNGGAGFGGIMPLNGQTKVCFYGACSSAVANLTVPLSVDGRGGTITVVGPVNVTVVGAPWTTGTASIGELTVMGGVSPLSNTGAPSGVLTLVSPLFISSNLAAFPVIPTFNVLTLHFVPEPVAIVPLGAGIAALGILARMRSK